MTEQINIFSAIDECSYEATVLDSTQLEEAKFLTLEIEDLVISAIQYSDGTLFTIDDWQCSQPTLEEIEDFKWVDPSTLKACVMIAGLPRLL